MTYINQDHYGHSQKYRFIFDCHDFKTGNTNHQFFTTDHPMMGHIHPYFSPLDQDLIANAANSNKAPDSPLYSPPYFWGF